MAGDETNKAKPGTKRYYLVKWVMLKQEGYTFTVVQTTDTLCQNTTNINDVKFWTLFHLLLKWNCICTELYLSLELLIFLIALPDRIPCVTIAIIDLAPLLRRISAAFASVPHVSAISSTIMQILSGTYLTN